MEIIVNMCHNTVSTLKKRQNVSLHSYEYDQLPPTERLNDTLDHLSNARLRTMSERRQIIILYTNRPCMLYLIQTNKTHIKGIYLLEERNIRKEREVLFVILT